MKNMDTSQRIRSTKILNWNWNSFYWRMATAVFFSDPLLKVLKSLGGKQEVEPAGAESGGIYESYGRGWLIQPEEDRRNAQKKGEWNKMKIRVVGDEVTTWINGTEMINLKDEKIGTATGSIALQIHDGGGI